MIWVEEQLPSQSFATVDTHPWWESLAPGMDGSCEGFPPSLSGLCLGHRVFSCHWPEWGMRVWVKRWKSRDIRDKLSKDETMSEFDMTPPKNCPSGGSQISSWIFLRLKIPADKTAKESLIMLNCTEWWQQVWGLALWTQSSNRRTTAETWHETQVEVSEAVQSVHHTGDLQADRLTSAVCSHLDLTAATGCVSATRSRASKLVNMKPRFSKKSIYSKQSQTDLCLSSLSLRFSSVRWRCCSSSCRPLILAFFSFITGTKREYSFLSNSSLSWTCCSNLTGGNVIQRFINTNTYMSVQEN